MEPSLAFYLGLIGLTALERLVELRVSLRNAAWSFARGGVEHGRGHYPFMVTLHTGLLLACPLEVILLDRPFLPAIGIPLAILAVGLQGMRWWCIQTLGPRWNTRVIIVPGLPRVTTGPYRVFSHPNYAVVVVEGIVLPMVHSAWLTAIGFSLLNAGLLIVRIRCEDRALEEIR